MSKINGVRHAAVRVFVAVALGVAAAAGSAGEPYVYPAKGQSSHQMGVDKAECQAWATEQTGYDPLKTSPAAAQPAPSQHGGMLRGGARGAAGGAAIGAMAGDAGKGAEIGAISGGLMGKMRQRREQQSQQQAAAAASQGQAGQQQEFFRAWGACLKGRGYSVD